MIQAPGTRGIRVNPADLVVGQSIIAVTVITYGELEIAIAGRRLYHVKIRDAGQVLRAKIHYPIDSVDLLQFQTRAQSPALLVLVISHDTFHMVQKFTDADISDLVVDIDRLESRAGAPVIGHSGVLAAPLLGNGSEQRLAGGTSRAGISLATPDNDDLPQRLVEIERRGEPILINHESSIALGILPAKPFGQPNVDVRQALLVPTDEGVAKFTPAHTVIAQEDHHRIVQNAFLFQKLEFLQYTRVHR